MRGRRFFLAPAHEREMTNTMDSFIKAALGGKAPEERSLEALQEAIAITPPDEGPDWVREIAELANAKTIGNEKP